MLLSLTSGVTLGTGFYGVPLTYELLRRQCRLIVAIDGAAPPSSKATASAADLAAMTRRRAP